MNMTPKEFPEQYITDAERDCSPDGRKKLAGLKQEKKVFNKLKACNIDGYVIYSRKLHRHVNQTEGEADFVVITPAGIFVLEVKGGKNYACPDGHNFYVNGEKQEKTPWQQADWNMRSIQKHQLGASYGSSVVAGYGVIFTKAGRIDGSLDPDTIPRGCTMLSGQFSGGPEEMERFLSGLGKCWFEKIGSKKKKQRLSAVDMKQIKDRVEPTSFTMVQSIGAQVHEHERQLELNDSQKNVRYLIENTSFQGGRMIIEGGAGTGKTILALSAAKHLHEQNKKVALVVRSFGLYKHLSELSEHDVVCLNEWTGDDSAYDCIVIDEGQDLLDEESLDQVESLLGRQIADGHWYWFMDSNNQHSMYTERDDVVFELIKECATHKIMRLEENVRNTKEIAIEVNNKLGMEMGAPKPVSSYVEPDIIHWKSHEPPEVTLSEIIKTTFGDDDLERKYLSIVTLGDDEWFPDLLQKCDPSVRSKIRKAIGSDFTNWPKNLTKSVYLSAKEIKGLENHCVVVAVQPGVPLGNVRLEEIYVAFTRANTFLWVLWDKEFERALNKDLEGQRRHVN